MIGHDTNAKLLLSFQGAKLKRQDCITSTPKKQGCGFKTILHTHKPGHSPLPTPNATYYVREAAYWKCRLEYRALCQLTFLH